MGKINYDLKSNLKKIIEVLIPGDLYTDQHFYKMHNMCKRMNVEGAAMQLLATMPEGKKVYEIEAFLDFGDHPPAYSGWDMLGGSEPDHYIINGREPEKSGYKPFLADPVVNRNKYPVHRCSCKRGNIIMHVYTSR